MEKDGHVHHKGTYILARAWGHKMGVLRNAGLVVPEAKDKIFTEPQDAIEALLREAMPDVDFVVLDLQEITGRIMAKALALSGEIDNTVIISSCPEIAVPRGGFTMEINRIIDGSGRVIGIGPRPGCPELREQLGDIFSSIGGRKVVLVEDGSFSGSTLSFLLGEMKNKGIKVIAVVLAFCFPGAQKKIQEELDGQVVAVQPVENPLEWMPDHDFFPFTPNSGRVFGQLVNGRALPFYNYKGHSFSVPYIHPFAPIVDWATVPGVIANQFSTLCVHATQNLFEEMEKMNGGEITIGDLVQSVRPRVSIPICLGQEHFPRPSTRVCDYLAELL